MRWLVVTPLTGPVKKFLDGVLSLVIKSRGSVNVLAWDTIDEAELEELGGYSNIERVVSASISDRRPVAFDIVTYVEEYWKEDEDNLIVMPQSSVMVDAAGSLVARHGVAAIWNVTNLEWEAGWLTATRRIVGDRLQCNVRVRRGSAIIMPPLDIEHEESVVGQDNRRPDSKSSAINVERRVLYAEKDGRGARSRGIVAEGHGGPGGSALSVAPVVVAAGRGCRTREEFEIVKQFAEVIGGEVAGSMPLADRGWIGHDRQVGLTGQSIQPEVYIACGISGAVQHVAGITGARRVVAVNTDPSAPIFKVTDLGIVGDLSAILKEAMEILGSQSSGNVDVEVRE